MLRPFPLLATLGTIVVLGPITGTLVWATGWCATHGRPRLAALCAAGVVATPFLLTAIAGAVLGAGVA
jgi:hypothetical protein